MNPTPANVPPAGNGGQTPTPANAAPVATPILISFTQEHDGHYLNHYRVCVNEELFARLPVCGPVHDVLSFIVEACNNHERLEREITTLNAALTRQRVSPVAAEEDTKRLDWLGEHAYSMIPDGDGIVVTRADDGHAFMRDNLREAVDAAMQQPATGARTGAT